MAELELEFRGLDELARDFQKVVDKYPDETANALMKVGKSFIVDTCASMPSYYADGKRPLNSPKQWDRKRESSSFNGSTVAISVSCRAPHWHLVENGHRKYINGKDTGGFVPGKHYVEKQSKVYERTLPTVMRGYVDKMLREENL